MSYVTTRRLRVTLHAVKGDPATAMCEIAERVQAGVIRQPDTARR